MPLLPANDTRRYNADVFGRIYDVNGEAAIDDVRARRGPCARRHQLHPISTAELHTQEPACGLCLGHT
jgi:hypothetical protein